MRVTVLRKEPFCDKRIREVAERAARELKDHKITVLLNQGLHRHYRCRKPTSSTYWFDIITWPGCLCIRGDMGCFVFARLDDMLEFFSDGTLRDIRYCAEKLQSSRDAAEEWCPEILQEYLEDEIRDAERGEDRNRVRAQVEEVRDALVEYETEWQAAVAIVESGLCEGCDLPSLKTWKIDFLWCLNAIGWFLEHRESAS